jgi:hypothetical protein
MIRCRVLLALVGLLLLPGIAGLIAVRVVGPEDAEAQAVPRVEPSGVLRSSSELVQRGTTLAGTVQATVTGVSEGGDPADTQIHSGPRLYQLVAETVLVSHEDALLGTSTDAEGRSGEYQGDGRRVLFRSAGDSPWELLVAAWALLGAAWLLRGAHKRLA